MFQLGQYETVPEDDSRCATDFLAFQPSGRRAGHGTFQLP